LGNSGEIAMRPGRAAVGRSGETDIRGAPVSEATHLKCGDDRRSDREARRLDLGFMLAGCIGKRVVTDLSKGGLGCCNAGDQQRQGEWSAAPPHHAHVRGHGFVQGSPPFDLFSELRASSHREPETWDWRKTITPQLSSVNAQNLIT